MWQCHAVSLGTIIISGVMNMVCCNVVPYLYTVFALNLYMYND